MLNIQGITISLKKFILVLSSTNSGLFPHNTMISLGNPEDDIRSILWHPQEIPFSSLDILYTSLPADAQNKTVIGFSRIL